MHVREFQIDDLPILIDLFHQTVHKINSRDYSPDQVEVWSPEKPGFKAWKERLSSDHTWVCEINGTIVGFARLEENGHIDLLYVHPEYQRQGIASALLEKIFLWARAKSIDSLSTESSITARPFFERFGFAVVKSQKVIRRGVEFENFVMKHTMNV